MGSNDLLASAAYLSGKIDKLNITQLPRMCKDTIGSGEFVKAKFSCSQSKGKSIMVCWLFEAFNT
jgi:hypothetical protein